MNASASLVTCPSQRLLEQFASGRMDELRAQAILAHLESCSHCQGSVDAISCRTDQLIEAARQVFATNRAPDRETAQLAELIQKAQAEGKQSETVAAGQSMTMRVSGTDFVSGLKRSGLLPEQEVDQCLEALQSDQDVDINDSGSLASALVRRKKLTAFQARVLLRGRWKGLVLGNYAILDALGQGGMGNVFKARHKRLGRIVCLKVVNSAGRQSQTHIERFRNEAKALARLSHPNIVVAHDADESKGVPFLVMEYIEGLDLAKHVRAHGALSVEDALRVTLQTAKALQYAHQQGVIHRDVKPHNLLFTQHKLQERRQIKVLDLGLARFDSMLTDNPDTSILAAMTNTGVVIGTVDYMSPEQALDSRTADARSDIYSLGCTLYFLLTGKPPFVGDTVMQRLVAHREQTVPSLAESGIPAPTHLDAVLRQMMAKDPEDRYQNMQAVAEDLQAVISGGGPSVDLSDNATPFPVVQPRAKRPRSKTPAFKMRSQSEIRMPAVAFFFAACSFMVAYLLVHDRLFPRSINEGGHGRALIVVSSKDFEKSEYQTIVDALKQQRIDVVTTSPNYGTGQPDFESNGLKKQTSNVRLNKLSPQGFDAVYVVGGENHDLSHDKEHQVDMKRLVEASMSEGLVISAVGSGWNVLKKVGYCQDCKLVSAGPLNLANPENSDATLILTHESKYAGKLVHKSLAVLSSRREAFRKETPWWVRAF